MLLKVFKYLMTAFFLVGIYSSVRVLINDDRVDEYMGALWIIVCSAAGVVWLWAADPNRYD